MTRCAPRFALVLVFAGGLDPNAGTWTVALLDLIVGATKENPGVRPPARIATKAGSEIRGGSDGCPPFTREQPWDSEFFRKNEGEIVTGADGGADTVACPDSQRLSVVSENARTVPSRRTNHMAPRIAPHFARPSPAWPVRAIRRFATSPSTMPSRRRRCG